MKEFRGVLRVIKDIYINIFKQLKPVLNINLKWNKKRALTRNFFNSQKRVKNIAHSAKILATKQFNANKQEFRQIYKKRLITTKLPPLKELEDKLFQELIEENSKLIKSIPERIFKLNKLKYVRKIQRQVLKGNLPRGQLEAFLDKLGTKYAKVVARTETAKMQAAIVEHRSKKLGAQAYIWGSTNDQRTRPSHRAMNGVLVLWSKQDDHKPYLDKYYGNPGEFFNCRCDAQPVFDERDLPIGAFVKVYSWRQKKVIRVARRDVLEQLK